MARAATAPARPRTAPAPRPRPAQPRRRSGPTVPTRAPRRRRRTAPGIGIARRLEAPVSRMLDALLQGRAWVVLIGVLLVGIVFFNVSLLGLNQGITRDSQRAQVLAQQNTQLRLQVADLTATERITQIATKKGMVMPPPGQVGYLRSNVKRDARRAADRIVPPGSGQLATGSMATTATPALAATQAQGTSALPAATPPAASSAAPPATAATPATTAAPLP